MTDAENDPFGHLDKIAVELLVMRIVVQLQLAAHRYVADLEDRAKRPLKDVRQGVAQLFARHKVPFAFPDERPALPEAAETKRPVGRPRKDAAAAAAPDADESGE